ncbi:MAG: sulfate ABC transporter permease subunit CysT, partial [Comamonas sp.]
MSAAITAPAARRGGAKRVLPGFGLTLGYTIFYLSIIVLIPLAALLYKTFELTWAQFWKVVTDPIAVSAYQVT